MALRGHAALILVFALITTVFRLRDDADEGFFKELFYGLAARARPGHHRRRRGHLAVPAHHARPHHRRPVHRQRTDRRDRGRYRHQLAELRRGHSIVLEKDHTVILGWSDSIFTIVRELTLANESRRKPVIVILADRDKVEMEDDLKAKVPDLRGTRVVCRSGSPMDIDDLALSSHTRAPAR